MQPRDTLQGHRRSGAGRSPGSDEADASSVPPGRTNGSDRRPGVFGYRTLVKNLVYKDLKLKYRGSVLGVAWSLAHPLLLILVYTIAFKHILKVDQPDYPYFLLVGLLPWNFFSGALLMSTGAVIGNSNLIKKVYFPREILPAATVLFGFAQFLLALVVFLPALLLVSDVPLGWSSLLFGPILVLHLLFTLGLAFALAALTTAFRDVAHLTEVALMLLFWMTPIIYPIAMAPPQLRIFFRLSPLAAFAVAYQDALFWGRPPDAWTTATMVGWTALCLVTGRAIFRWYSPTFAEEV